MLTTLQHWDHGFRSPFKSEIYFVNTTRFTDQKWGTKNPIITRDLNADDGFHVLAETPIEVIISDYQMPGKDGITFLKEIRSKSEVLN